MDASLTSRRNGILQDGIWPVERLLVVRRTMETATSLSKRNVLRVYWSRKEDFMSASDDIQRRSNCLVVPMHYGWILGMMNMDPSKMQLMALSRY